MYYGTQYWKDGASAGQCEMFPAPGFTYIAYCNMQTQKCFFPPNPYTLYCDDIRDF